MTQDPTDPKQWSEYGYTKTYFTIRIATPLRKTAGVSYRSLALKQSVIFYEGQSWFKFLPLINLITKNTEQTPDTVTYSFIQEPISIYNDLWKDPAYGLANVSIA